MNPDPDEHTPPGQEDLNWGDGIKETQRDKRPASRYWALSEQARKIIPGESQCRMFCGGKACKYCTPFSWRPEQMVIDGLYSEWVTDNIVAMARMSTENIEKFKMIARMKKLGIKTIINLQQPGEHAYCGHGINANGFSYDPQRFMEAGFFFYNFVMGDYGVASMQKLLDIVKVTQFAVSEGKLAVHCHAGLGRTGLVIACYLIYNNRVKASKSVQYVRSRRAGAIQTKEQVNTCHEFEQYLRHFYVIFPSRIPEMHRFSFGLFLNRQRNLLHGYEGKKLKHLPKIIYVCCERLLELCRRGHALSALRRVQENRLKEDLSGMDGSDDEKGAEANIGRDVDNGSTANEEKGSFKTVHSELKRLGSNHYAKGELDDDLSSYRKNKRLSTRKKINTANKLKEGTNDSGHSLAGDNLYGSSNENSDEDYVPFNSGHARRDRHKHSNLPKRRHKEKALAALDIQDVADAILSTHHSVEESEEIINIEENLNTSDEAWGHLAKQTNPAVICSVMWDWLDGLCEPILRAQDVYTLIENANDLHSALSRLEKSTRHFLEYVTRVVSKLEPLHPTVLHSILNRFLCHLTQKKHGNFDDPSTCSLSHMMEEKPDVSQSIFDLLMKMVEREKERD